MTVRSPYLRRYENGVQFSELSNIEKNLFIYHNVLSDKCNNIKMYQLYLMFDKNVFDFAPFNNIFLKINLQNIFTQFYSIFFLIWIFVNEF